MRKIETVHMVEALGRGGIFQHSLAVAAALSSTGVRVVLHTAADSEIDSVDVDQCRCVHWHRGSRSRILRQAMTSADFTLRTLPHLRRNLSADDVLFVQGFFALTPEIIRAGRSARAAVVCSPHNTFVRNNARGGARALDAALRRSDRVLVYSEADAEKIADACPRVGVVPLVQWVPSVDAERTAWWRDRFKSAGRRVALLAGQVRADKNPELFVKALSGLPGWCGAVVGEDKGAGPDLDELIRKTCAPVTTFFGYYPLPDFAAAISAADVVVAPYSVASQSGIVSLSRSLGVPTAVTPVGGLSELATVVAPDATPQGIGQAIRSANQAYVERPATVETGQAYLQQLALA